MSQKKVEANFIKCDMCGVMTPQSCIIFEKGGSFPELVNKQHKKHGVEICSRCFTHLKVTRKAVAA